MYVPRHLNKAWRRSREPVSREEYARMAEMIANGEMRTFFDDFEMLSNREFVRQIESGEFPRFAVDMTTAELVEYIADVKAGKYDSEE